MVICSNAALIYTLWWENPKFISWALRNKVKPLALLNYQWFGYPTFWVNRTGFPNEALGVTPGIQAVRALFSARIRKKVISWELRCARCHLRQLEEKWHYHRILAGVTGGRPSQTPDVLWTQWNSNWVHLHSIIKPTKARADKTPTLA